MFDFSMQIIHFSEVKTRYFVFDFLSYEWQLNFSPYHKAKYNITFVCQKKRPYFQMPEETFHDLLDCVLVDAAAAAAVAR